MGDIMTFPATFDEFAEQYKIVDKHEVYTNGTALIPIFRVKQWLEDNPNVAPKSEVKKVLNEVELLIIITKEMYKQQMEDAPNELSKQSKRTKWVAFEKFYEQFAELKQKYTE